MFLPARDLLLGCVDVETELSQKARERKCEGVEVGTGGMLALKDQLGDQTVAATWNL